MLGDTAAERAVLIDRIGPSSSPAAAVLRFGPDNVLYVAIDDGGDVRAGSDPGSFSGKVLRLNADATTPRDQMSASPVYAMEVHRPRGLDWDSNRLLWIVEPGEASAFAAVEPSARRGVRVARHQLPEGTRAAGLLVYRGARVPQLQDNLLMGSPGGRGLLRVRSGQRPRTAVPDEGLLRGVVDGVRALALTSDGAIYAATVDTLVRIVVQPPTQ